MRILIIAEEEWNDVITANGVMTNWFSDFDAEFAHIYCSPGMPLNDVCEKYFQITDSQMFKSLFLKSRAGKSIKKPIEELAIDAAKENLQKAGIYKIMKQLSLWLHTPVMMIRDFIWLLGRYNKEELNKFVSDFNPDIIFCPQYGVPKLWRLERYIHSTCKAPMIAFTGDDEVSYKQVSYSPLYWLRRWYCRKYFKKTVGIFTHYLMFSDEQANEYKKDFSINTSQLFKCGIFPEKLERKAIGKPIRLVYAGRLYCNRWKSLVEIGKALREINKDEVKMVLDIYTQETLTKKQAKYLSQDNFIYVKGAVPGAELANIYKKADIALHVESFDRKYRYATRVSFSTKIIDLMASTCAIMAVCWEKHFGYQYLRDNDAAFCCPSYESILPQLQLICDQPSLITEYQEKAYNCGLKKHQKSVIQKQITDLFQNVLGQKNDVNGDTPLVSIIVPCYKVESYLPNCIKSVISQTYDNWELILIDDGSPDKSGQICDDFTLIDPRITVIHKSNGGPSSARNSGLDIMKGEYVTFLDSDDFWHRDYLKVLMDILAQNKADVVQCDFVLGNSIEFPSINSLTHDIRDYDNHSIFVERAAKVVLWGKIYKASLFDGIRMPEGLLHEDDWTTWKLYYKAKRISVIDLPLYYYTYNLNGIMATRQHIPDLTYFDAYRERIRFFVERQEKDLEDISRMQWCLSLVGLYSHPMLQNEQRKMMRQIFSENLNCLRKSLVVPQMLKLLFYCFDKTSITSVFIKYYKTLKNIR